MKRISDVECIAFGTRRCKTCSDGQQKYCQRKHEKLANGTYNISDDLWDYIELVVDDDDEDW